MEKKGLMRCLNNKKKTKSLQMNRLQTLTSNKKENLLKMKRKVIKKQSTRMEDGQMKNIKSF